MIKIAVSGYYGFNNAGDEAILEAVREGVGNKFPDAKISILDRNNRFNLKMILDCDVLLSGGGSLFQDKTSVRSFLYYTMVIRIAKLLGKKVFVFAQGIGPINRWHDLLILKRILKTADLITVRDMDSFNYYKSLKLDNPKIVETADPTFILSPDDGPKLLELEGLDLGKRPLIGVSVRDGIDHAKLAAALDRLIKDSNAQVVFIPLQFPRDLKASEQVINQMKEKPNVLFRNCTPRQLMGAISCLDLLIGMRLHSLIFAVNTLVPAVGISYDPKVESFMSEVGLPCLSADDLNSDEIKSTAAQLLDNIAGVKKSLEFERRKMRARAETNFGMLEMLMKGRMRV